MTNNIHFVYIGDPLGKDLNAITSGIKKLTEYYNQHNNIEIVFRFWTDHLNVWKKLASTQDNLSELGTVIEYFIELDDDILKDLKKIPNIEGASLIKRIIMQKDLASISVLKNYGGYFLDNNVWPLDGKFPEFSFDKWKFKVPANEDMSNAVYMFTEQSGWCCRPTIKRRLSMQSYLNAEELDQTQQLSITNIECWMMYSEKGGSLITKIYYNYFKNLLTFVESAKIDSTTQFLDGQYGIGRVIINSIIAAIYEPELGVNSKFNELALTNRKYFWTRSSDSKIEEIRVQKSYGASWRGEPRPQYEQEQVEEIKEQKEHGASWREQTLQCGQKPKARQRHVVAATSQSLSSLISSKTAAQLYDTSIEDENQ